MFLHFLFLIKKIDIVNNITWHLWESDYALPIGDLLLLLFIFVVSVAAAACLLHQVPKLIFQSVHSVTCDSLKSLLS